MTSIFIITAFPAMLLSYLYGARARNGSSGWRSDLNTRFKKIRFYRIFFSPRIDNVADLL